MKTLSTRQFWNVCCVQVLLLALSFGASVQAQTLTWASPVEHTGVQVGGQPYGMGGVGAAVWNGDVYIAYADNSGNGNLWTAYTTTGAVFTKQQVNLSSGAPSDMGNPSLAVFNNLLYLAWINTSEQAEFAYSADGVNFTYAGSCTPTAGAVASPSLTVFQGNLYMGIMTASGHYLAICKIAVDNTATVNEYPSFSVGDMPALGAYNNTLYAAFRDDSSSHYIYLAESTDGVNFLESTAATSSHTSTACSIVVYGGILYIGFRQNSSSDHLYYTYSTDGVTFSAPIYVGYTMGGPPALIDTFGTEVAGQIFNVFRQNDTGHYLYTSSAGVN